MAKPGDILSYLEMCAIEAANLQRGMNWRLHPTHSVVLMSRRAGAPYADQVEDAGRTLVYEGHDVPRTTETPFPKRVDQPEMNPGGRLTQNGLFMQAARAYREGKDPERVRVYEKIKAGIWVYNGVFLLTSASREESGNRQVFKFRLELEDEEVPNSLRELGDLPHNRMIPTEAKLAVWKRDGGQCVKCHSQDNLHFDHVIPFSRGGSSLVAENIQVLCARHNLAKHDHIE